MENLSLFLLQSGLYVMVTYTCVNTICNLTYSEMLNTNINVSNKQTTYSIHYEFSTLK